MKYFFFIVLFFSFFGIESVSAQSSSEATQSDQAYWDAKKADAAQKSTVMRKEYYAKYLAKGYDLSSLTPDLLDGSKTDEGKFWEALKKLQNQNEMPGRKEYVEKLRSKGIDVSVFTDSVMNDSGKFWELANKLYAEYEQGTKKVYEEKKEDVKKIYEEKKTETKPLISNIERAKKLFVQRLEKVAVDKRFEVYPRLEKNIVRQIEIAKQKENTLLTQKLESMLVLLRERMTNDDDELLINNLFTE